MICDGNNELKRKIALPGQDVALTKSAHQLIPALSTIREEEEEEEEAATAQSQLIE